MRQAKIQQVVDFIQHSRSIAVLTGAGISTSSGIPDFRSSSGIYATETNAGVFELDEFARRPESFYRFAQWFYPLVIKAQPNAAHGALAHWETDARAVHIATQNVDDLHQRAGSSNVSQLHGTWEHSLCPSCGSRVKTLTLMPVVEQGRVPRCVCGGVMKPAITFFGEALPERAWQKALAAMSSADLVLVAGTSLVVYPAASLPEYRSRDAHLVVINRDETVLDAAADVCIRDDLTLVMAEIDQRMV